MGVVVMSHASVPSSSSLCASLHPSSTKPICASPVPMSRFPFKCIDILSKSLTGLSVQAPPIITLRKASAEFTDGRDSVSESDDDEEHLLSDELLLDPKLQQKLEHKLKMKLTKKIRLRRKKLVRKRRMRKKGRWPPSKANNLKDV